MKFVRIVGWLVVILLNIGCGKKQPAPWPASIKLVGLSQTESNAINTTLNTFSQTLGTEAFYFDNKASQFQITITKNDPTSGNSNRAGLATFDERNCTIQLNSMVLTDSYKNYLEPVLWHELGHCSGMEHDPKTGEIMYYLASTLDFYTQSSIERFMKSFEDLTSLKGKL